MSSKPGFWRQCRIAFRCARFTIWAAVLLLLVALGWFNLVGLPGFLKTRLVTALQERGVQLEFSRMRLRFVHGLVCDNVRVGESQAYDGPVLTAREVQLRVNLAALLKLHFQVDGLVLRKGLLALPFSATNALALTNLDTELRFSGNDTWTLDRLSADFAGANLLLAGEISHAAEIRHWKMFSGAKSPDRGSALASLKNFSDTLERIHFEGIPQLSMRLYGDARDVHSFSLNITVRAPAADTPWFNARDMQFAARVTAPGDAPVAANPAWGFWTNLQPFGLEWTGRATNVRSAPLNGAMECSGAWNPAASALSVNIQAPLAKTPWFSAEDLHFGARVTVSTNATAVTSPAWGFWTNLQPFRVEWNGQATNLVSTPVNAGDVQCTGAWNASALAMNVSARAASGNARKFHAQDTQLTLRVGLLTEAVASPDPAWGLWTNLQPFRIEWSGRVTNFAAAEMQGDSLECLGAWSAPELAVNQLRARLGGGTLEASAKLGVPTRQVTFNARSSFDLHAVAPLLTEKTRERLAEIAWNEPPHLAATGSLVLPPWSDGATDWHDDIEPSIRLQGDLAFTNALIAGVAPLDRARTHFEYAHLIWRLPDLELVLGHTTLHLAGEENETTKNFHCTLGGSVDADSIRPFLTTGDAVRGFGHLTFHQPASLSLEVNGNLRDVNALWATGRVAVADFAIRGQSVDSLSATLAYTNLLAEFFHPQLARAGGAEQFAAEKLTLDLDTQRLFLYGGEGHVLPAAVAAAIGPKTAKAMEPYQFLSIPNAKVHGCIPLKHVNGELVPDDADLWFEVIGTAPFRWKKFETPEISGRIHWLSNYLILTNVVTDCYGGPAHGWGKFDVQTEGEGTDFSFYMEGTNVNFHAMGLALWSPTNQLRGQLSGAVMVTHANSSDWHTWNGYGWAELHQGLLWDAPIFGLMSPVLNTLTPGLDLGNSRATDGSGHFSMTNGVVHTDTLVLRSLTMRLDYVGTVDLEQNVQARVKAQLLRNTPVLGTLFSTVLWPVSKVFECEVTGSLEKPKITPLYIPFPKVLSAPLHPIRTMEQLFTAPATNPPAGKP